jgi:O-antigen/teichoic acid export membrane protein
LINRILNTFGTKTLAAVINLLIAIVLSQFLGPEGKGQQGLIITTIAFILVFSNIVGGGTLVYLVPRYSYSKLFIPSYIWSFLISILSYLILELLHIVESRFILNICILSAINSFVSINSTLLIGKEKIKTSNFISISQPFITIVALVILFGWIGKTDVMSYLIALYLAFCITWLISMYYVIRVFGKLEITFSNQIRVIRDMFKYGFLNQLAHITQFMSFRLSYYFIDMYHGEGSVGVYSNGISIVESIWLISKSISLVQYARIANVNDEKYAQKISIILLKGSIIVSFFLLIILLILPISFYTYFFGKGFEEIKLAIWMLAPGVLIYNISIILGHYFSGRGKYHLNTISSSIGLLVSIMCYFLLIPRYNIMGAGGATSISYFITSLCVLIFFLKESKVNIRSFLISWPDIKFYWSEIKRSLTGK